MRNQDSVYRLSEAVVYRTVGGEVVLIEVGSGVFYHFSEDSGRFFDYFREPRSVASYLALVRESEGDEAATRASELVSMLVENKILEPGQTAADATAIGSVRVPQFLRLGEQKLEHVRFLY